MSLTPINGVVIFESNAKYNVINPMVTLNHALPMVTLNGDHNGDLKGVHRRRAYRIEVAE